MRSLFPRGGRGNFLLIIGLCLVGLFAAIAVLATKISPHDPIQVSMSYRLIAPFDREFLLGSDQLGRCVLSRLLHGARITFTAVFSILFSTLFFGTAAGCLSGYTGGRVDGMIQKVVDGVMAFPPLILGLAIAGIRGPGIISVIVALAAVQWLGPFRVVRNLVVSLKERPYVAAAKISGAGSLAILSGHILPKVLPVLAIFSTLQFGRILLSVAALSFLGLGAQPPYPEWGSMLSESKTYMQTAPHLFILPGVFIALSVLGVQLTGMGLQKNLDDRRKGYF
jgi:ABC-type dipeptide/oligopeptide/nickel transport system permease subunit